LLISHRGTAQSVILVVASLVAAAPVWAADQTQPGAGNARATALAAASPLVSSGRRFIDQRIAQIRNVSLHVTTLQAIDDPNYCIAHRADLTDTDKDAIVTQLTSAGLLNAGEVSGFPGGARAGVFPPVSGDGSHCPKLPQRFYAAPGSGTGGHHTYPGGLVVHESFNSLSYNSFADNYRRVFGHSNTDGLAEIDGVVTRNDVYIDQDIIVAAPLWHDWAKAIVFQWNADGSEFSELHIAGTGGHHIISVAEIIKRGVAPDFVIAQASAHTTPSEGSEGNVVNYIRAASIIARVDPVAKGYLRTDGTGALRLAAVRALSGNGAIDLNAIGRTNLLVEYVLHNLSDGDWILAEPAVDIAELVLANLAPQFGYSSTSSDYTNRFRNPVLSYLSAERILMLYSNGGLSAVKGELTRLHNKGVL
jgi:hypothetical protein